MTYKTTNEFGFPQTVQADGHGNHIPVCSQCLSCVMPNKGQGTICDKCEADFNMEMEHERTG